MQHVISKRREHPIAAVRAEFALHIYKHKVLKYNNL
jgi:hypothetical protein